MNTGIEQNDPQAFFDQHRQTLKTMVERLHELSQEYPETRIITSEQLVSWLKPSERRLFDTLRATDPTQYGFRGEYLGADPVPRLVSITDQTYEVEGKTITRAPQYLPEPIYRAYQKMNYAYMKDTGRKLLVFSGYRSPAYQLCLIFYYMVTEYDFSVTDTLRRVALPDYSHHCSDTATAIDFTNQEGTVNEENTYDEAMQSFKDTPEYVWLQKYGQSFGFQETYGPDNPYGVLYEPWHWQYQAFSKFTSR